ncbi:MAG: uroporphyrinogen decarboxylase family protein [SAR202 cluster bacterium]|nr:uroporphyrinogen decarboxylase family protein [SAR202 cluster bacterium]
MASMTPRERVRATLSQETPDRVPLDFGTIASSIDNKAYGRLAKLMGMESELERADLNDPLNPSKDVTPCAEMLELFGVDTRAVHPDAPIDSQALVRDQIDEYTYRDEWGVLWVRPHNEDGPYMYKEGPFQKPGVTVADVEAYPWPDADAEHRVSGLAERARKLHEETDYAIVLSVGHSSLAPAQRLRGFGELMEDLVLEPERAAAILENVTRVTVASTNAILREAGPYVDVVSFSDDLGLQDRAYFRNEMFQKQVKPYLARCVDAIHANTNAKVVMHSDGAIYHLIPDLIDIGVDVINPVQTTAWSMEAEVLKAEFGNKLGFWGAVDTQHALPFGTPDEVRADVKHKIDTLGAKGGYVVASCHTIREEVPAENIRAMYEAALEYGRY